MVMAQWRLAATQAIGEQEAKGINVDLIALIFCLIFVFTHANNQHLKIKFVHVSKYI